MLEVLATLEVLAMSEVLAILAMYAVIAIYILLGSLLLLRSWLKLIEFFPQQETVIFLVKTVPEVIAIVFVATKK